MPPPTAAATVATTLAGIRRAHRRPLDKKTALVLDRLLPAIAAIPDTLPGLRDRALLLVGFAAALRPSEIAGLAIEHLARHADGIELFLPWRKNDQDGRGTKLWLPQGRTELCPVAALETWLAAAEITKGPLFRRLRRLPPTRVAKDARPKPPPERYRLGAEPIDTDSIALIEIAPRLRLWPAKPAPSSPASPVQRLTETAEIVEAFTRKADGKILQVDRSKIFPQAPPGSPQVPKFTDRKQKVIVFPDVNAGDAVVYTFRRTGKPFFPGQFFSGSVFQRNLAFEDARMNITLPKAMAAHVFVEGAEHQTTEGDRTITHSFLYRNPQPLPAEAAVLSPWDTDRNLSFLPLPIIPRSPPRIASWPKRRRR
jgi:hypothetical protein